MRCDPPATRALQDQLQLLDTLRQLEAQATSLRVAAIVGHLIAAPLSAIREEAGLIRAGAQAALAQAPLGQAAADAGARAEDAPGADAGATAVVRARQIEEHITQLTQRIRRLIEYLNAPEPALQARPLAEVISDALALYAPIAEQQSITLAVHNSAAADTHVQDSLAVLMVLTTLLSIALQEATRPSTVTLYVEGSNGPARGLSPLGVANPSFSVAGFGDAASQVHFELEAPGMAPPRGRIDSMEPPDEAPSAGAEHLPLLAVCFAIVRRWGGALQVQQLKPEHTLLRFSCPALRSP